MIAVLSKICCCSIQNDDDNAVVVSRYEGEKNCFGQRHGYGTYMFPNGGVYRGRWKFDKMHGYGVLEKVTGDKVEGFFKNGEYCKEINETATIQTNQALPGNAERTAENQLRRTLARREMDRRLEEGRKRREYFYKKYGIERYGATA